MQFWQQLSCNLPQLTEKHPSPMPTWQHLANGMIFVPALKTNAVNQLLNKKILLRKTGSLNRAHPIKKPYFCILVLPNSAKQHLKH
jgi:hypothetical protein